MSERVYAALMRVYPSAFRDEYADEMLEYFRDRLRDERARGGVSPGRRSAGASRTRRR